MRSTRSFLLPLIAVLLLLLIGGNARAQGNLLFTLDSVIQNGTPGSEVYFTGTLTNTGTNPLYLNGIQFDFDSLAAPYLTGDANVFFNNTPVSLAATGTTGDSYAGQIFGINVDPTTPSGTYTGSVTLTGGADGNATDILGTQNFEVVVSSAGVPEASSLFSASLMLGMGGWLLYRRKCKQLAALQVA
jgi:hypothetical protein